MIHSKSKLDGTRLWICMMGLEALGGSWSGSVAVSHKATISFARHCPELKVLEIIADIAMPELINGLAELGKESLKPLSVLKLGLSGTTLHDYDARDLAYALGDLAPSLDHSHFFGVTSNSDRELDTFLDRICARRRWRVVWKPREWMRKWEVKKWCQAIWMVGKPHL